MLPLVFAGSATAAEVRKADSTLRLENQPVPGLGQISKDVTKIAGKVAAPRELECIAWSAKACTGYVPPRLAEEVILLVRWSDSPKWLLCHMERHSESVGADYSRYWQMAGRDAPPFWKDTEEYDARPTEKQIVKFIHETNFGNNECYPSMNVLQVVLYASKCETLFEELKSGVSSKDKQERVRRSTHVQMIPESKR